ncbi:MAG: hypothetical protein ABEH59_13895 [Halobacteriales archaeon]
MGDGRAVYAFRIDGRHLFKRYFERDAVFNALGEYYDDAAYRFEVPGEEFESAAELLSEHGFELVAVEDPERFCVVTGRYEPHAAILQGSVVNWMRRGHRFFLMRDPVAVEQAVQQGAKPVGETEFEAGI